MHEEEFYYEEIEEDAATAAAAMIPASPPTLSHRDMARPPHEDPEYQRQIVGNYRQGLNLNSQQNYAAQQQQHQINGGSIKPPLPLSTSSAVNMNSSYASSWSQQSPVSGLHNGDVIPYTLFSNSMSLTVLN